MSASASYLVPGAARLLGCSVIVWDGNGTGVGERVGTRQTGYDVSKTRVSLLNGDGGDELFAWHLPVGKGTTSTDMTVGNAVHTFMLKDGSIRFDSGIYMLPWDGNSVGCPAPARSFITVYYEGA